MKNLRACGHHVAPDFQRRPPRCTRLPVYGTTLQPNEHVRASYQGKTDIVKQKKRMKPMPNKSKAVSCSSKKYFKNLPRVFCRKRGFTENLYEKRGCIAVHQRSNSPRKISYSRREKAWSSGGSGRPHVLQRFKFLNDLYS